MVHNWKTSGRQFSVIKSPSDRPGFNAAYAKIAPYITITCVEIMCHVSSLSTPSMNHSIFPPCSLLLACAFCFLPAVVVAEQQDHNSSSEFLLFLSADYERMFDNQSSLSSISDFTPAADLLYSNSIGNWRVLAEYLLTDDESELERLQFGYDASDESTFWFGRFHQPTSAWVAKYHHGRFLQTSISRPAVEEWEDDGGVVPAHISGVMLDHGIPLDGGSGTRISMAFGAGPFLRDGELSPFDFLSPNRGKHRLSAGMSIAYFPDYLADTNFGFSGAHTQISVEENSLLGIDQSFDINQTTLGAQLDWRKETWQLLAAAYYIHSSSQEPSGRFGGWFVSGYAEVQRDIREVNSVFGRVEFSQKAKSVDYLNLFPDFATKKVVVGYRFEFRENQAVSIEISDESWLTDSFRQARIQWSAVFP